MELRQIQELTNLMLESLVDHFLVDGFEFHNMKSLTAFAKEYSEAMRKQDFNHVLQSTNMVIQNSPRDHLEEITVSYLWQGIAHVYRANDSLSKSIIPIEMIHFGNTVGISEITPETEYTNAINAFDNALQIHPVMFAEQIYAHFLKGIVHYQREELSAAVLDFRSAIAAKDDRAINYALLADTLFRIDERANKAEAKELASIALRKIEPIPQSARINGQKKAELLAMTIIMYYNQ